MLTHTRARLVSDDVEFGNYNGFFVTETTQGTLTCTLWNADVADTEVRTVVIPAGITPSHGIIPLAVKKIDASAASDLTDLIVIGV